MRGVWELRRVARLLAPTAVLMACAMSTACAFSFRTVGSKDPTVEALRAVITALEQRLPPTPSPTPTPTPEAKQ